MFTKRIPVILVLFCMLYACKKDNDKSPNKELPLTITGTWEITRLSHDPNPTQTKINNKKRLSSISVFTLYPKNNQAFYYEFTEDGKFKVYENIAEENKKEDYKVISTANYSFNQKDSILLIGNKQSKGAHLFVDSKDSNLKIKRLGLYVVQYNHRTDPTDSVEMDLKMTKTFGIGGSFLPPNR